MDNKYNILHTFEQKLKESIENSKTQDSVINGLRNALNESLNERQRLEALAEKESEKCHHLNDLLTKRQIESKIAIETQTIEWREEKALLENHMKRLTDQMSDAKHNACQLQNKCSQLQQSLAAKDSEVEKQSAFKTTIGSEIRQLHETIGTLRQEFSALTKTHGELKNLIQMENDMNCGLKRQLKEQYEELVSVKNEKCLLETQVSELKTKLNANSGLLYEKDLQSLRLNQTNEMQKQEINELREQFKKLMTENENLTKSLAEKSVIEFNLMADKNMSENIVVNLEDSVDGKPDIEDVKEVPESQEIEIIE